MLVFIIRRLIQSLIMMIVVSLMVFAGVYAIGNPVDILISPQATQAEIDAATHAMGLDRPLHEQYLIFLANAFKGDLGTSFLHNEPTISLILQRLPATLELALSAMILAVILGIPLGMIAGMNTSSWKGRGIMAGSILGFSLPNFWVGLLLIMVFAVELGWLPANGRGETVEFIGLRLSCLSLDGIKHLILPAVTLALFQASLVTRLTRSGMSETLPLDFVKFAKANGVPKNQILFVHVLKNILIPIVTILGMSLGGLIAFATVTESVFAWPGVGKLFLDSIAQLDRPVIVAYIMMTVLIFILLNLIVDILYSILDPRVRLGSVRK
jgi:peptide/nickel transport system permease protein